MIKKLFLASIMMLTMFSFSSCCDGDDMVANDNGNGGDTTPTADYTVIYVAIPGGTDQIGVSDLIEILRYRQSGAIGDNVNFVGRIKTTDSALYPNLQNKLKSYGYDGTMTFDLNKKIDAKLPDIYYYIHLLQSVSEAGISSKDEQKEYTSEMIAQGYKLFFDNTTSTRLGGMDYKFATVDSIASFIKSAAEAHPAKNYVLILYGHGNGFDLGRDLATTRAAIADEGAGNTTLSAEEITTAVKQSGVHIQTLVCHNCEMAALENFPHYQQAADYVFMSSEETTGTYIQDILKGFSKAGNDVEKMKEAARNCVDTYIENVGHIGLKISSIGFYDMSKTSNLMAVIKRAGEWYADAMGKDPVLIDKAVRQTLCSQDVNPYYANARDSIMNNKFNEPQNMSDEEMNTYIKDMMKLANNGVLAGFVLSDMMYNTLNKQSVATTSLDFNTLKNIYDDYILILKDMAYIKVTAEDTSVKDYAYIFSSPTVHVLPLNSTYNRMPDINQIIVDSQNGNTATLDNLMSGLTTALRNGDNDTFYNLLYEHCACYNRIQPSLQQLQSFMALPFDQQTGWSNFLKKVNFIPTYATVPIRAYTVNQQ